MVVIIIVIVLVQIVIITMLVVVVRPRAKLEDHEARGEPWESQFKTISGQTASPN